LVFLQEVYLYDSSGKETFTDQIQQYVSAIYGRPNEAGQNSKLPSTFLFRNALEFLMWKKKT
jgi:hypothetical protein